ncbi:N-acetylmuramoyl-L-alanine amidase-like domain-containing protein [Spirosoma luteum]|uniref:N-acetylmuramoyl-L-alanine amidase-like domain-containing protein n=1 Tax=Spirosoma luteum TaxID=431553 RepID=UPI0003690D05|nr:N-acetylmuramoyl-L-alanine amidase-like domain-containing protein [Spirosoma luteum]
MRNLFTTLLLLLLSPAGQAQGIVLPSNLNSLTIVGGKTLAETTIKIGKQFIGNPYTPHTLDVNPTEQLVVNVREFDCTTYLETVLALSLTWQAVSVKQNPALFDETFRQYLTRLRYRDGRIEGYASRLHYFSDWLRDNEQHGLLTDVTHELPGSISVAKSVSYMTASMYRYPRLQDPAIFKQVARTEASLSQQPFAFVPKKNIRQAEAQLQDGDIVMLMAARPGLDMKHVGLAVRQPDGRMHLLHASSDQGEVVITKYPISDYLLWHKHLSGIRVARLK